MDKKTAKKRIFPALLLLVFMYYIFNCIQIYFYSFEYSEDFCDVAIVFGAGTSNNMVSPVFRERLNHSVLLYKKGIVGRMILTGGYGKKQKIADSEVAKEYIKSCGVPDVDIILDRKSEYTIENIIEAKALMDSLGAETALLVSDPIHMKRSVALAKKQGIDCKPSPTQTSMYKTIWPKAKFILSESLYYSMGVVVGRH